MEKGKEKMKNDRFRTNKNPPLQRSWQNEHLETYNYFDRKRIRDKYEIDVEKHLLIDEEDKWEKLDEQ